MYCTLLPALVTTIGQIQKIVGDQVAGIRDGVSYSCSGHGSCCRSHVGVVGSGAGMSSTNPFA